MATILITHGVPSDGFTALKAHHLVIPAPLQAFSEKELLQHIMEADAVVACGKLPGHIIRAGQNLKIIANYGAGYDGVDIAAAAACGVPVTNIPDIVTRDTAELAIGLMLAVSRRIGEMNLRLRREAPETLFGMGRYMGKSLRGQVLGVVGYGRIGRQTAELARAMGMHVIYHDPAQPQSLPLDDVLQQADIITLHCPANAHTRHLINAAAFAQMMRGALLINTARGAVVDYDALLDALDDGILAGAGLDVYPDEPRIPAQILAHDHIVCTPHIGTNTEQTRYEMAQACAQQILDVLDGKRPENIVNGL